MSQADIKTLKDSINSISLVAIVMLLAWNVHATSTLQVSTAVLSSEVVYLNSKLTGITIQTKEFRLRLNAMERTHNQFIINK